MRPALVLATIGLAIFSFGSSSGCAQTNQFKSITEQLIRRWPEPSYKLIMSIVWSGSGTEGHFHCKIVNVSDDSLLIDSGTLPWNNNLLFVPMTIISAAGETIYPIEPIVMSQRPAPSRPLAIASGQTLEGDMGRWAPSEFYIAHARGDLLILWHSDVGLYTEPHHHGDEIPVSGAIYVPKE
jgi:hypothetical protein